MGTHEQEQRFRRLFDAEARSVLGYALRRVESREDAADVVAETFAVAWRRIADVPPGDQARPWLYGVARRVLANQRRGELRRRRLADRLREQLSATAPALALGGDGVDAAIAGALARLPEHEREVLLLACWEGLAPAEIAVVLQLPGATVRTRLHRARARLRTTLTQDGVLATATPADARQAR
jgi:RNA polymerase sigma factor (sigma-70 family)